MRKVITLGCATIGAITLAVCVADAPSFAARTLAELGVFLAACVVSGYALAWAFDGESP